MLSEWSINQNKPVVESAVVFSDTICHRFVMFHLYLDPVDKDEQEKHESHEHCSKSSPKFSRLKKNDGQVKYTLFNSCFVGTQATLSRCCALVSSCFLI